MTSRHAVITVALASIAATPIVRAQDALTVTHTARALAPGEVLVVTAAAPPAVTGVTAVWRDRPVPFQRAADGRWEALIGVDVAETAGPRTLRVVGHRPGATDLIAVHAFAVAPKQWRTRRLTVPRRFVDPPPSALPRIREETALLNAVFAAAPTERRWRGPFARPVEGVAVSGFGVRSVLNGQARGPHNGADFAAGTGTPIVAPAGGRVVYAREFYYSGNTVILDHGAGLFSTMAHLSAFDVREGDAVARGDLLGKVGATGRVTGPHLHWAVRLLGARVDPEALFDIAE